LVSHPAQIFVDCCLFAIDRRCCITPRLCEVCLVRGKRLVIDGSQVISLHPGNEMLHVQGVILYGKFRGIVGVEVVGKVPNIPMICFLSRCCFLFKGTLSNTSPHLQKAKEFTQAGASALF